MILDGTAYAFLHNTLKLTIVVVFHVVFLVNNSLIGRTKTLAIANCQLSKANRGSYPLQHSTAYTDSLLYPPYRDARFRDTLIPMHLLLNLVSGSPKFQALLVSENK